MRAMESHTLKQVQKDESKGFFKEANFFLDKNSRLFY